MCPFELRNERVTFFLFFCYSFPNTTVSYCPLEECRNYANVELSFFLIESFLPNLFQSCPHVLFLYSAYFYLIVHLFILHFYPAPLKGEFLEGGEFFFYHFVSQTYNNVRHIPVLFKNLLTD